MLNRGYLNKEHIKISLDTLSLLPIDNILPELINITTDIENNVYDIKLSFDGPITVELSHDKIIAKSYITLDEFTSLKKEVIRLNKIINKMIEVYQ